VYWILWDDIQVADFTDDANSFQFIGNAGEARSVGFELEVTALPTPGLDLQATLAYANSELTEDQPTANFGFGGRDGDEFPNVPEWQGSLSSRYTWPLSQSLDGFVSGDFSYVDGAGTQFNPTSPIYNLKDDYAIFDAKVGVRSDRWTAQLFIDNALDELAEVNIIEQASNLTPRAIVPNRPRTIGVNVSAQF
jgi:outer membrane receptor protein involved in Fe transport